ncbi:hypothetical protein Hanom_Chr12g01105181 [Helianthus anomalus]
MPFFFERQNWITNGPLEYHRVISGTGRKPNKYGKNSLVRIEHMTYCSQSLFSSQRCHLL